MMHTHREADKTCLKHHHSVALTWRVEDEEWNCFIVFSPVYWLFELERSIKHRRCCWWQLMIAPSFAGATSCTLSKAALAAQVGGAVSGAAGELLCSMHRARDTALLQGPVNCMCQLSYCGVVWVRRDLLRSPNPPPLGVASRYGDEVIALWWLGSVQDDEVLLKSTNGFWEHHTWSQRSGFSICRAVCPGLGLLDVSLVGLCFPRGWNAWPIANEAAGKSGRNVEVKALMVQKTHLCE